MLQLRELPYRVYSSLCWKGLTDWVPDEMHLKIMYRRYLGCYPNFNSPVGFNEKINWLKMHDRQPIYTHLVDKYEVKSWVADKVGAQYVTPAISRWDSVDSITIDSLPDQFVLKTNHDCGGIAICRDKAQFDLASAKKMLKNHLQRNYYYGCREWPYKDVTRCVFAEEYLEQCGASDLIDYKFYCFDGNPAFLYVSQGMERHETAHISFINLEDWSFAPFGRSDYAPFDVLPEKPASFEQMLEIAKALSEGMPFVRVDLFEIDGLPRFSEMTFHPCAGFMPFEPVAWDRRLGDLLHLPAREGEK